jgi:type II secretory pathway pseudopilin PulG
MKPSSPVTGLSNPTFFPRRAGGFTLVEAGLLLVAVAMAGYIAASEVRKSGHRAQRDQFIAELRTLAAAFENHREQKGAWPPATNPDIRTPLGMELALAGTRWLAGPPFGGNYEWMPPAQMAADRKDAAKGAAPGGYIAVTAFSPSPPLALTPEDLRYIDAKLDDGNLATGRFRTGFNGWPLYLVEPAP